MTVVGKVAATPPMVTVEVPSEMSGVPTAHLIVGVAVVVGVDGTAGVVGVVFGVGACAECEFELHAATSRATEVAASAAETDRCRDEMADIFGFPPGRVTCGHSS